MKKKIEMIEVECPKCGKKRLVIDNIPFFGDIRICPEHEQGGVFTKEID